MTFKKYPKIHRLGKDETIGILNGVCTIQEKIDGANVSIWIDKRGEITCASRNRELFEGFNGFVEYVKNDERFKKLFEKYPGYRLYGEWLVRHTISYKETAYKKFYLFDITEVKDGEEVEEFLTQEEVQAIAKEYDIDYPVVFDVLVNPSEEQIKKYVGVSMIGDKGEGVVIKNHTFRDNFGNHNYAKVITEAFKEDNGVIFGGNNKFSDTYWEMYVCNKYITLSRVRKVMNKLQPMIDEKLDMKHIPRIMETVYHDMLTEEIYEIAKKVKTLDFDNLKRICAKKTKQIFVDIINDNISVADEKN